MNAKRYPVIIEQTGTGYSAYSPDVPGCVAVGDTQEETRRNFRDALAAHFEAMCEVGELIPNRTLQSTMWKARPSRPLAPR
ncbi:MAG TPA: type II toxin-antitoxin system HicB family antitoxin [Bryobacteraceae bacterium]|nr:type II toxin-antitoxin system HicB family antitoxin [Bryobacteraceae bacterium]